jgi:hypothetical protein
MVAPMAQPLVSIIIPCGSRHADLVRTAAASVAWQSLAHLCETIIACDGGAVVPPMDNVTILASDGERHGPAHTRNRALAAARGAFTLPLDADDYLLPRAVENLLREYGRGGAGYVYGDTYTLERDGRYMLRAAPDYVQDHMRRYNIHVVTALTPTRHWRAVGGWDEGVDAWEDWSGHLRLAIAGVCGRRLPQPVFTYRVYEGDRMTQFYGGAPELMERVLVRYRNSNGEIPMSACCGGDADLVGAAQGASLGAPLPPAAAMEGNKVRVEYLGEEKGSQTWDYPDRHSAIRLGNNAIDRYKDITLDQADWLKEHGIPIRVVPIFDQPDAPTPLPILQPTDVLTPDASSKVIRPRAR